MNELNSLEERLNAAIGRIEAAATADDDTSGLIEENARLKADLDSLKQQRQADLAELDHLMAKLRPLLEEADA